MFRPGQRPRFDLVRARQLELMREEGPNPEQAVAECVSAQVALAEAGLWPGPRDPESERAVEEVRARWAKIQHRARQLRSNR